MNRRILTLILITGVLLIAAISFVIFLIYAPDEIVEDVEDVPFAVYYRPVTFADLSGWLEDDPRLALQAFQRSCVKLLIQPDARDMGANGIAGSIGDWDNVCQGIPDPEGADIQVIRDYLEANFQPVAVTTNKETKGRFTGYYVPEMMGARQQTDRFSVPLYRRPDDLVMVDLGRFRPDLRGERIAGRVAGSYLDPYSTRGDIAGGALDAQGLELLWVEDQVEAFFLHIQGSGQVRLENDTIIRVGYDGHNGHLYNSLGRDLIDRGLIQPSQGSMQGIKGFLRQNTQSAQVLMNVNPSFIFFRLLPGDGPEGAQGVVLTDRRSLAVDRRYMPLGVPIWLDVTAPTGPTTEAGKPSMEPFKQLMVAQDTGGAIKGAIRGDVYWGAGVGAGWIAGHMSNMGSWYMLLPKAVAARLPQSL